MIRLEAFREYVRGALWVFPSLAALGALIAGSTLSQIEIGPDSPLAPIAFQGTADDARALLIAISGTVITVIALVLGLTVVALQLSSTQFSPRLLRNFLRDRPNQLVMSAFVATFAYSAAGLYTVGVSSGVRTEEYPRLAVSGSLVLLFASLGLVVFFADHLVHSIQIDAIMRVVERSTVDSVRRGLRGSHEHSAFEVPPHAVVLRASRSGYVQTAHPELIMPTARKHGISVRLCQRVGEHAVVGTPFAWIWSLRPEDPPLDPEVMRHAIEGAVRVGFERTYEQDAALGIRQLVDVACKALSPAVNDPYTAIQAIDHLAVIFCSMACRPLGADVVHDPDGGVSVTVPSRRFDEYLAIMCGLVRRYGSRETTVLLALIRLLSSCETVIQEFPDRLTAVAREAALVLEVGEAAIEQPTDVEPVRAAVLALQQRIALRDQAASADQASLPSMA